MQLQWDGGTLHGTRNNVQHAVGLFVCGLGRSLGVKSMHGLSISCVKSVRSTLIIACRLIAR